MKLLTSQSVLCTLNNHASCHFIQSHIRCVHACVGELGGEWGKQVGSMNEESQVRGCYNITFICAPTRKQCLCWKRHKQTKHTSHTSEPRLAAYTLEALVILWHKSLKSEHTYNVHWCHGGCNQAVAIMPKLIAHVFKNQNQGTLWTLMVTL